MGYHPLGDSTWQVLYLAVENPYLAAVSRCLHANRLRKCTSCKGSILVL